MTVPPFPGVPGERGLSWLRLGDVISSNVFSLSRNLASREQDLGKGRAEVLVQPAALGMGFRKQLLHRKQALRVFPISKALGLNVSHNSKFAADI